MAGLTDAGARSVLETLTWQRARIAELEAALRGLLDAYNGVSHSGHMAEQAALAALTKSTDNR